MPALASPYAGTPVYPPPQTAPPPEAPPPEEVLPPPEAEVLDGVPLNAEMGAAPAPVAPGPEVLTGQGLNAPPPQAPPATAAAAPPPAADLPPATPRQTGPAPLGGAFDLLRGGETNPVADHVGGSVGQIPVLGGLLTSLGNLARGGDPDPYRPADPNVQGLGPDLYAAEIAAREAGVAQAQGPRDTAGAVKDLALAHLQEHKGEISPLPAHIKREMTRLGHSLATTGHPPVDMDPAFVASYENDPFVRAFVGPDSANYVRAVEEGYTTPEGITWAPGVEGDAAWEYHAGGLTGPQRAISDVTADPVGVLADVAASLLTGGGSKLATEGAEQTARGIAKTAVKQSIGTGMQVAGRGIDAAATMGLSEAVPGTFTLAGKALKATPLGKQTAQAAAEQTAQETAEIGGALLSERRATGAVGPEPTYVNQPAKGVTQVTLPPQGAEPAIDLTFRTGARGLGVVDPGGVVRRPTEADFALVQQALSRLPQRDRQAIREPWWAWAMRQRDAAGNDLLDPLAPDLPARAGRGPISTGRNREAHQRWVDDVVSAMRRFDDPSPTGNRPVLYELLSDWRRTLFDDQLHPLTRAPMAEHRLQGIKNVLAALPEHRDHYAKRQLAQMERQLPRAPGVIGTGQVGRAPTRATAGRAYGRATATGQAVAYTPAQTARLERLATESSKAFFKGKVFARQDFSSGLLARVPPGPQGTPRHQLAYENFQGLLEARLNNPVLRRGDVGAMRDRFRSSVGAPLTQTARRELDGLKEALDRSGIVPGAPGMPSDQVEVALSRWLKANPAFAIDLPPGGARLGPPPPLGIYRPGSAEEILRRALPEDVAEKLEETYSIGGRTYRVIDQMVYWHDTLEVARRLAQERQAGRALSAGDQRLLERTVNQINKFASKQQQVTGEALAGFSDGSLDRLGARLVAGEQEIAAGLRRKSGQRVDPRMALTRLYDNYMGALRSLLLYNRVKGAIYPMQQVLGNPFTALVANRSALGHYNPLELRTIVRFMKDPEHAPPPAAVRHRERIGLGRSRNLGNVSRDESHSAYTWFHDPEAGTLRRLGRVLVSQAAKEYGDAADIKFRHALWDATMRPAEKRLRQDMPAIVERIFTEARHRTGLTLPLSRDQIATALRQLEDATNHEYNAVELREALFEAAGGRGAANSTELYNAADRAHRLFQEELRKLDDAAQKEVDRVAFAGEVTHLSQALERVALFSWWNRNAARLYLTEVAKSPIQMGLWARGIQAGESNVREGKSEGYKHWIEFMRTPAGFTMSLNPVSLAATMGLFAQMDETSPKEDLTTLGRITQGGWLGNNLFLAPPITAALRVLGALGPDARRPDLLGQARTERDINDLLEYVNYHVYQFYTTREGKPRAVPNLDLNAFQDFLGVRIPEMLGREPVNPRDADASPDARLTWLVRDRVLALNPELAIPDAEGNVYALEAAIQEAMANPDSEIYQAALGDLVGSIGLGPGGDRGGAMAVIGALATRVLPFQLSVLPTSQADRLARVNRDRVREETGAAFLSEAPEATAVDQAMAWLPWQTEEGRAFDVAKTAYYTGSDPAARAAIDTHYAIKYGEITEPITLGGVITFTPEQLAMMSQKDRNAVAYFWLEDAGHGEALDAFYGAREEALRAHPALADAFGWEEYIAQYPGGIGRAVDDTALVNPNVRRWAEETAEMRQANPEEWEKQVQWLGPLVAGIKESRFGVPVDPQYRGIVGGLGQTVGAWYLEQGHSGGGSEFQSERIAAIEDDLPDYTATLNNLNAWDPSGATAAEYTANLIAGSDKPIPYGAYKAGITGYTGGDWFGAYLEWGMSEPQDADTSPARWAEEDSRAYNRRRTIEIANEMASGTYVAAPSEAVGGEGEPALGLPNAGRPVFYQQAQLVRGATAYQQPNGRVMGGVPAGMPFTVIHVGDDGSGVRWALLQDANGVQFYVPTSDLRKAA